MKFFALAIPLSLGLCSYCILPFRGNADASICNGGIGINVVPPKFPDAGSCMLSSTEFVSVLMHIAIALGNIYDSKCDDPQWGSIDGGKTVCDIDMIQCDSLGVVKGYTTKEGEK